MSLCLFFSLSAFSQKGKKVVRPYAVSPPILLKSSSSWSGHNGKHINRNNNDDNDNYKNGDVLLYMIFSEKSAELCKCSCPIDGKQLYEYDIYGKIVNKSDKNIKVTDIAFFTKNYYESCKHKGNLILDEMAIFSLPRTVVYVKARSEKYVSFESLIKLRDYATDEHWVGFSYVYDSNHQFNDFDENKENDIIKSKLRLVECGGFFENPYLNRITINDEQQLDYYQKLVQYCPEDFWTLKKIGDIYYNLKEKISPNWLKNAISYYEKSINQAKTRLDEPFKTEELKMLDSYWNLANLYEYAGLYEQSINYYNYLLKYNPCQEDLQSKENLNRIQSLLGSDNTDRNGLICFSEEAKAHIIVCKFLIKNRPARSKLEIGDPKASLELVQTNDFSDQAIQERSGLGPIQQLVEEVDKQQQYKIKNPNIKGKVIDVAMMALGWAIAPKDMKADQRNRFIMGALSTLVSLIDQDKISVSAGGLSSDGMLADLAGLKSSPVAQEAATELQKLEPPANTSKPATQPNKVETAGGVTITNKLESINYSGIYHVVSLSGDCGQQLNDVWKTGTHSVPDGGTFTSLPIQIRHEGNQVHISGGYRQKYNATYYNGDFTGSGVIENGKSQLNFIQKTEGYALGIHTNTTTKGVIEIKFDDNNKIQFRTISREDTVIQNPNCSTICIKKQ